MNKNKTKTIIIIISVALVLALVSFFFFPRYTRNCSRVSGELVCVTYHCMGIQYSDGDEPSTARCIGIDLGSESRTTSPND